MSKKAAKKTAPAKEVEIAPKADKVEDKIKTRSEVEQLSPKEREKFRANGGTVIEDPAK